MFSKNRPLASFLCKADIYKDLVGFSALSELFVLSFTNEEGSIVVFGLFIIALQARGHAEDAIFFNI